MRFHVGRRVTGGTRVTAQDSILVQAPTPDCPSFFSPNCDTRAVSGDRLYFPILRATLHLDGLGCGDGSSVPFRADHYSLFVRLWSPGTLSGTPRGDDTHQWRRTHQSPCNRLYSSLPGLPFAVSAKYTSALQRGSYAGEIANLNRAWDWKAVLELAPICPVIIRSPTTHRDAARL